MPVVDKFKMVKLVLMCKVSACGGLLCVSRETEKSHYVIVSTRFLATSCISFCIFAILIFHEALNMYIVITIEPCR